MATCKDCKDCLHYELCEVSDYISLDECGFYTDRSRFVELPCKIGNKLYLSTEARDKIMRLLVLMSCDPELLEVESEEYIKQLIKEYGNNGKC